ncbi:iron ABC transporter permease [Candidatus Aerophobetes bacterium]|uniref:Iron ABC transporter permease n=1 Tax=Aerophobetes bacterium TaxID=2030807 RepID=A0A497E5B0_UNCAE|nr:MAG: iron ABC transporter permease [Candidatus Aerophobetes bacterium]
MNKSKIKAEAQQLYLGLTKRKTIFIIFLSLLIVVITIIAANLGAASLGIKEVISAIFSKIFPAYSRPEESAFTIIWELRLPRIFMSIVVGMGLAVAGTVMQGVLKNPLASPYTLGIASAAGFGAALAIISGIGFFGTSYLWIATNAFLFALLSSFLVLGLAKLKKASPETLILAGVAMMFLFSAMVSFLQYTGTTENVTAVVFWLMGDLSKASWLKVGVVALIVSGTFPLLMRYAWDFNALTFGDETAKSLGIDVEKVRLVGLVLSSLLTAGTICFVGTIGFIGLASPHISRMIIGGDHRFLLPTSCLMGAVLLLAADTAARTIFSPLILPIGILTSFLGVPLFVWLIIKRRKEYW